MPRKTTTNLFAERAMILFMWALVAAPAISFVVSPNGWRYAVALEHQRSGDFETAEELFKGLTEIEPNNVLAWYRRSEIAVERKEYSEALQHVNRALWYRLAKVALERNDYKESMRCIDRAVKGSEQLVDLPPGDQKAMRIGDHKATILLMMGKGQQAISLVKRFIRWRRADTELSDVSQGDLNELISETQLQVYFNKLAYLSAVGGVELNNAKRLIDAVLLNFNQEETDCRLSLPYLHELNGEYEKALIAYAELLLQVQSELPPLEGLLPFLSSQFGKVESSPAIRDGDALEGFSCRFKILHRMKLIVEKLSQTERLAEINLLIENLPDDKKSESSLELIVDTQKILEQASSFRSYLDTRAFVNYRRAEMMELSLFGSIVKLDLTFVEKARSLYKESLSDIERAIAFHAAIEKFNLTQPLNSLMVRRTTDENVSQWFERKNSAVLYFHYALILESNGRFKDAAEARQKVAELGFEIDEKLF